MARPQRLRRICCKPQIDSFKPAVCTNSEPIFLSLDEYEVIRLIDLEQKTHQQCALQMDISRSTVQEIYEKARCKIAACLVYGRRLIINGGNYRICNGKEQVNCRRCCQKAHLDSSTKTKLTNKQAGGFIMKIAVTYEGGKIFQHFGRTEQFKLYEVAEGKIVNSTIISTDGNGHGALAVFLMQHNVSTLICGGIGMGAQNALAEAGITFYGGVSGSSDEAVTNLLANKLIYDTDCKCEHHHDGASHTCGNHGCH